MNQNQGQQKQVFYVGDLRDYLKSADMSIEALSKNTGFSHMTIRRWLKKKDNEEIPAKYAPTFGPLFLKTVAVEIPQLSVLGACASKTMDDLMSEISKTGINYSEGPDRLEKDVKSKLKATRVDKIFLSYCKRLLKIIRLQDAPLRVKAVCIGALLYFINPVDLIPDHIPIIGYLDDLAVLAVALNYASSYERSEDRNKLA